MIDNVVKTIVDEKLANVHTTLVCTVVRVNGDKADVKPINLRKYADGSLIEFPVIKDVEIPQQQTTVTFDRNELIDTFESNIAGLSGDYTNNENGLRNDIVTSLQTILDYMKSRYMVLKKGDKVAVSFYERSPDENNLQRFGLSDGVVIGVIT